MQSLGPEGRGPRVSADFYRREIQNGVLVPLMCGAVIKRRLSTGCP